MNTPMNKTLEEKDQSSLWHAFHRYHPDAVPFIAEKGEGSWFTDTNGNRFMDGVSGLWCLNLGYGQTELIEAATEQMSQLAYFPLTFGHQPAIDLAEKLDHLLGGYRTFFSNGGSDANETAFKIARQHHKQTGNPEKFKIISRYRAYHGNSLGALSATAQANRKMKYDPPAPGFLHVPPPYAYRSSFGNFERDDELTANYLEQTILWEGPETVAAFIMEPVISGGGVLYPQTSLYFDRVREICDKYNVLLILDEVVSGFGRTGKMFGHLHAEHFKPDIITLAKGLTSGYLPLGATCVKHSIYDSFKESSTDNHFRHISTYGGHPASCAVALKAIDIIERKEIVERVEELEETVLSELHQLSELSIIGDVRGIGFLYGIELVTNKESKQPASDATMKAIVAACQKKGLIIGKNSDTVPEGGNVLIVAPPLTSTEEDLRFLIGTIKEVIQAYS
ncbi:aminotransferase [Alkalicoccobacillus porphyridii]|uniref:Aminotransferase class III-fold pyridoxal phosphate-dependent enzyme n=1 Tax=Alkalicoccobacillus porphyridii TaxID=2597270 RepID=A0A554A1J0_9BACI|nr:aminotransferase [Alkalicoccobacillus porphyridii]TSB47558.1 aminotransferase class III-fold pyridoxal phosphate-dependent enzyme [Alkalicoccobacillus porphyridii]